MKIAKAKYEVKLTERENLVFQLFTQGLQYSEIAKKLNITSGTVNSHIRNIFKKFGLHSRSQLVIYAAQHGLSGKEK